MPRPSWVFPLLSATFLTSVATHHVFVRRNADEEKLRLTAQETILKELIGRMKAGERIQDEEWGRMMSLVQAKKDVIFGNDGQTGEKPRPVAEDLGWRETVLGKKVSLENDEEEVDIEDVARKEWEAALQADEATPARKSILKQLFETNVSPPATPMPSPPPPSLPSSSSPIPSASPPSPSPSRSSRFYS